MPRVALTIVLAALVLTGCASRPKGPLQVPLTFRLNHPDTFSTQTLKCEVYVSVIDARTEQAAIGQNSEKPQPVMVQTADSPAGFVKGVMERELKARGATIAAAPDKAQRQIVLELTRFWTDETDLYRTAVSATVKITGSDAAAPWQGKVQGGATNFGRSLSPGNYQEAISDATLEMVRSILNDPKVIATLAP